MPVNVYISKLANFLPELQIDDEAMEFSLLSDGSLTVRLLRIPTDLDSMSWESTLQLSRAQLEQLRDFINESL